MLDGTAVSWAGMLGAFGLALFAGLRWLRSVPAAPAGPAGCAVWLFDGPELLQASDAAKALLRPGRAGPDWMQVAKRLADEFPAFPRHPDEVEAGAPLTLAGTGTTGGTAELRLERIDGIVRVALVETPPEPMNPKVQRDLQISQDMELRTLRQATAGAPYPSWMIGENGRVSWFNAAYAALYERMHGAAPDPGKPLFQTALDQRPTGSRMRVSIKAVGSDESFWYDVTIARFDILKFYYAADVNAVVKAETAQRNFVQTLAKTFAQLSIGLAIFDRNRQLALFNPALIDLTCLPADFLSARPNLMSFFDRLRDARIMPEPKNYSSWRAEMADLVAAADDGRFGATWSLPSGSTYRVSGRPHPDGAVAFLFEDITAEITLTRRFRSELELSQSMLDKLEDAIAVFAQNGVLTLTNRAYRELWGVDPDSAFADTSVADSTRVWEARSGPHSAWGEVRNFVLGFEARADWNAPVTLPGGAVSTCSVHPVQGGATMVVFHRDAAPGLPQALPATEPAMPS